MLESPFDTRTAVLAKRVLRKAEKVMSRLESKSELTATNITQLRKLGMTVRDLRAKPWREHGPDNAPEPTESFLAKLAREGAQNRSATEKTEPEATPELREPSVPSWIVNARAEGKRTRDADKRSCKTLSDRHEAAAREAAVGATLSEEPQARSPGTRRRG
jgi:hypothetical protein